MPVVDKQSALVQHVLAESVGELVHCCSSIPGKDDGGMWNPVYNGGKRLYGPCLNPNNCDGEDHNACHNPWVGHPTFCNENQFCMINGDRNECVDQQTMCSPGAAPGNDQTTDDRDLCNQMWVSTEQGPPLHASANDCHNAKEMILAAIAALGAEELANAVFNPCSASASVADMLDQLKETLTIDIDQCVKTPLLFLRGVESQVVVKGKTYNMHKVQKDGTKLFCKTAGRFMKTVFHSDRSKIVVALAMCRVVMASAVQGIMLNTEGCEDTSDEASENEANDDDGMYEEDTEDSDTEDDEETEEDEEFEMDEPEDDILDIIEDADDVVADA